MSSPGQIMADPHVPWWRVEETASVSSGLGAVVTLRRYAGMRHEINAEEIERARVMLQNLTEQPQGDPSHERS